MTDLVLVNPEVDTVPSTVTRNDPQYDPRKNIIFAHWGTWLSMGQSVLGFTDNTFPPHNVRYDIVETPLVEDIERSVEFYPGGHISVVGTQEAVTALRAQGYTLTCLAPTTTELIFLAGTTYLVSPSYDPPTPIAESLPDFDQWELRTRTNDNDVTTLHGPTGGVLAVGLDFALLDAYLSFSSRLISADGVHSEWSETMSVRNPTLWLLTTWNSRGQRTAVLGP
ncbi:MAG: hypothetical protein GY679_00830 [Mycoplasma sp.]|nr:hypothetical protein [Mycoplasma sp.]